MPPSKPPTLWRLFQWIIELCQRNEFGTIEISLQNGQVGMVHFRKTMKPEELPIADVDAHRKHFAGLTL